MAHCFPAEDDCPLPAVTTRGASLSIALPTSDLRAPGGGKGWVLSHRASSLSMLWAWEARSLLAIGQGG